MQYEIWIGNKFMTDAPTQNSALAKVSLKWHGVQNVEIRKRGAVIWRA